MSDLQAIFNQMEQRFDASAAEGMDVVFQYRIDEQHHWYVTVAEGRCQVAEGEYEDPTVTLTMDSETLRTVLSGETDGMEAFMTGRIRADGNIIEATRLGALFPMTQGG